MAGKKIGLAFSGGGARGFSHIGVLKVLVEDGISIDIIAGTSAGSIIGAMFAAGMSVDQITHVAAGAGWMNLGRPSLRPIGLFSNEPMGRYLKTHLPVARFEDLKIPFVATGCDIETGELVLFRDPGDLIFAIRASCAVPGIFAPLVDGDGRMIVDGGAVKPLPVDVLREMGAGVIIAVDVLACGGTFRTRPRTAMGVAIQSALTLIRSAAAIQHPLADIVIAPEIAHIRPDQIGRREELIGLGEKAAREALPQIRKFCR